MSDPRDEAEVAAHSAAPRETSARRPKLAKKVRVRFDDREKKWMLLSPERGLLLNGSAKRIVELCDGTRTEAEIAALLADEHGAAPSTVAEDVTKVMHELRARVLVEPGT